ncbi:beta-galactosidase [Streptomyces sp. NPDC048172]|uniref:beta-galactosidase n=1 Tax=Streptomyces sp. NPDC048172 TaxID=3365505 RepID=UPI003723EDC7
MTHDIGIVHDARDTALTLRRDHLAHWGGTDPRGRRLTANNYFLELDGEPLPLVAGELQLQRYPAEEWEQGILALKSAGCTMVSSYVFWNLVEPRPGEFDFSGGNDVRRFAELCHRHGLLFSPRVGPYNNAEFSVGGLPPWLYGMPLTERSNDPRYLRLVGRYYDRLGQQLSGLYWQDGGPVLLVQLENELTHAPNDWRTLFGYTATDHRGPTGKDFTAHMERLRQLALEAGIDPPVFSMTGWGADTGEPPADTFLVSYGGYMDLHPRPRNSGLTVFGSLTYPYRGHLPVAFCELGGGSPTRAAYRPVTAPDDVLVGALSRLGTVETIMLGYYMMHGGTNPVRGDFGWMTKEPEFSLLSYDFGAPVSEYGERRAPFYRTAPLNRFVTEFGPDLAHMRAVQPAEPVTDPEEDRLRTAVRSDGTSAFVLLANYGNRTPLSARDDVTLVVALDGGDVRFPRRAPLSVASGESAILPVELDLGGGMTLVSATAQPLARLRGHTVFFRPGEGDVEYTLRGVEDTRVSGDESVLGEPDGVTVVTGEGSFTVNETLGIVTLSRAQAEHSQVADVAGERRLVTSPDDLTLEGDTVTLSRRVPLGTDPGTDPAPFTWSVLPAPDAVRAGGEALRAETAGPLFRYTAAAPRPALGPDVVEVEKLSPSRWLLRAPDVDPADPEELAGLWADVDYTGDLCRMFDAGTGALIGDDFHHGVPWRVKLGRFRAALAGAGLQLRVEPRATSERTADAEGILLDSREEIHSSAEIHAVRLSAEVVQRFVCR